jgi:hypothetical protein
MKELILLLFLSFSSLGFGQTKKMTVTPLQFTPLQADTFIGIDGLGFLYYIKNNIFCKQKDVTVWEYKNVSLGKITRVDLLNPLKIVLFYENFNTVVLLDNQLNENQKINFSENTIPIVATATGIASQNQLWIYNSLNQQIGLYNYLKKEYKTLSIPFSESIKYYQSNLNSFDWIDEKNIWYSIDAFGKTTTKGTISNLDSIVIINSSQFIYSKDNLLFFTNMGIGNTKSDIEIEIQEKTFKNFYYKDQILSIFTAEGITNYKITTP